ncbi:MAG: CotH kinase family protein, partial [Clostridia bacterium]
AYTLMNEFGVASPLTNYASVSVNGETFGLYLAVEAIEDAFLQRNYGTDYGTLYKPETTSNAGGEMSAPVEGEISVDEDGISDETEQEIPQIDEQFSQDATQNAQRETSQQSSRSGGMGMSGGSSGLSSLLVMMAMTRIAIVIFSITL